MLIFVCVDTNNGNKVNGSIRLRIHKRWHKEKASTFAEAFEISKKKLIPIVFRFERSVN